MSDTSASSSAFGRLLWPERTLVTDLERKLAETRIDHAVSIGQLDPARAQDRRAAVRAATTHADLRAALDGGPASLTPPGLRVAPRVGAAVWLVVSAVNTIVWFLVSLFSGQWDGLWLLWPLLGGGVLVLGLWSIKEWDRRMRLYEIDRGP
jgi:hypothetical protein